MNVDEAMRFAETSPHRTAVEAELAAEVRKLRGRVDELRPMAAHGVRNPPEVVADDRAAIERVRELCRHDVGKVEAADLARMILLALDG